MALELVKIAKIGEKNIIQKTSSNVKLCKNDFFYRKCSYKLIVEIDIQKVLKGNV